MYSPDNKILKNYSDVLVNFALGGGKGIKAKEVIYLQFDLLALPLALEAYKRILENDSYPIVKIQTEEFSKLFYQKARDHQLEFFPKKYTKSLVDTIDHRIYLMADKNPFYLKNIDPKKIMKTNKSRQLLRKWLFKKEDQGKLSWTIALYGTLGMAKEAGLSLKEYWKQIAKACFLNDSNPIDKWKIVFKDLERIKKSLNKLSIDKIHLISKETDLWIRLGKKRVWMGGGGRNIPSFEIFTSPDWRGTNGKIYFDFPLYRYGNIIKGIFLEFKNGRVIKAKARKNEKLLKALVSQKNADKIGEFSLTDKRFSKIDKFMAHTLYDENFGGKWGNTHLALGSSYHDAYDGKMSKMKAKDWRELGFNESQEHTDIMAKDNRQVEVILKNKVKKVIYKDGEFLI